jgi:hypothetical protein
MKKTKTAVVPAVVETYDTEIEYTCPVRGKVKQMVRVRRFETVEPPAAAEEVLPKKSLTEELDRRFSGLLLSDDLLDEQVESENE